MESSKPLLLPHTILSANTASRAGVLLTIVDLDEWDRFIKLLEYCNGKHTTEQIATALSLDITLLNSILSSLEEAGFIWCLPDYHAIPTPLFLLEFNRWLPIWVHKMYDQPQIWQGLYEGHEPASIMIGWAQENMHYTRSVMSHMPLAAQYATTLAEQQVQFRHLSEEWDHYHLFMAACQSTGISVDSLNESRPLASTLNITLFMRNVAKLGVLVYNACEALLEATTDNGQAVVDFYQTVGQQHNLPNIFTDELIHHLIVDKEFGHINIFEHLLENYPALPASTVTSIFSSCHQLADWFEIWNDDIYQHYRQTEPSSIASNELPPITSHQPLQAGG
ncbi:MarR family transcriptional regulator [Yersinia mollaretii]|uniref:MarR family transcriptional regulator n=1 Tax=Yersinia mollaretii TaxID=33060 RepID=UPI00119EA5D9|nr:MarR family transcriptional regulator [Yersinia mollaretii]